MPSLICPHCQHLIDLIVAPGTVHSTQGSTDPSALLNGSYQPNPTKQYKTPEYMRRAGLAFYYEHREEILSKARAKRAERKRQTQSVSQSGHE